MVFGRNNSYYVFFSVSGQCDMYCLLSSWWRLNTTGMMLLIPVIYLLFVYFLYHHYTNIIITYDNITCIVIRQPGALLLTLTPDCNIEVKTSVEILWKIQCINANWGKCSLQITSFKYMYEILAGLKKPGPKKKRVGWGGVQYWSSVLLSL